MFVTSVGGAGNLGSWPDAGGETGTAAGDAICRARAAAAGLPRASTYRAWLSDATDDAYCRIHGFTGRKSQNCGQPTLPAAAGPWLRTDGLPFAGDITAMLEPHHVVLYPPAADELGRPVRAWLWTGTAATGEAEPDRDCSGWTSSAAGRGQAGGSRRTAAQWTSLAGPFCDVDTGRLICFEPGVGEPLPTLPGDARIAFVSSATGPGELGSWPLAGGAQGVDAADAICRALADGAGLQQPSAFRGWVFDTSMPPYPWERFEHEGPFRRLDGAVVARRLSDLALHLPGTSINVTESGNYVTGFAWFGIGPNCLDWTDATPFASGRMGSVTAADEAWASTATSTCEIGWPRLYCFHDVPHPLYFSDGFESGDVSWWSSSQGLAPPPGRAPGHRDETQPQAVASDDWRSWR